MWNKIRIWHHKRQARYWHERINDLFEVYDCGEDLIDMMTGGKLSAYRGHFREHMSVLQLIDPKFKKAKQ